MGQRFKVINPTPSQVNKYNTVQEHRKRFGEAPLPPLKPRYIDRKTGEELVDKSLSNRIEDFISKTEKLHTPITSEAQRGFFGAELARKRAGKETKTGMTEEQLVEHLHESKGRDLPEKIEKGKCSDCGVEGQNYSTHIDSGKILRLCPPCTEKFKKYGSFKGIQKSISERINNFIEKSEKEPQIPGVAWDHLTPEQKVQIRHTRPDLFIKKQFDRAAFRDLTRHLQREANKRIDKPKPTLQSLDETAKKKLRIKQTNCELNGKNTENYNT